MKTSLPFSVLSRFSTGIAVAGLTLVSSVSVQGQSAQGAAASSAGAANAAQTPAGLSPSGAGLINVSSASRFERGDDERKVLADAKTLVKGNSLAAAEAKLTSLNVAKANTADWHMETNHRLMQMADSLARDGQRSTTKSLVTQSLQHLEEAEKLAVTANDVRGQAQAKAATGKIHERYRGDPVAAISAYQAALKLTPADKGIEEALDRLQRSYANAQAKVKAPKKR